MTQLNWAKARKPLPSLNVPSWDNPHLLPQSSDKRTQYERKLDALMKALLTVAEKIRLQHPTMSEDEIYVRAENWIKKKKAKPLPH
jgi:hypothetical protein